MTALSHDCPHCGSKSASFSLLYEYRPVKAPENILAFFKCGVCSLSVCFDFHVLDRSYNLDNHYCIDTDSFRIVNMYPGISTPTLPEHLPNNVAQFFGEAVDNIITGPNAAGAMFRKSVDVGLKIIAPDIDGPLVSRIDTLAKNGTITKELADWAHYVRLEGNEAAHDEEPFTPEEAGELHKFADLLMRYLFTLPGMLKARRNDDPL